MKQTTLILLLFFSFSAFNQEDKTSELIKKSGYTLSKAYEYLPKFGEIDLPTKFLFKRKKYNSEGLTVKEEHYYNGDDINEYARIDNL
jgi:hypothetical protein